LVTALASEATAAVPSHLRAETFSQATAYAVSPNVGSIAVRTLAGGVMRSMKGTVALGWLITGLTAALLSGAGVMLAGALAGPPAKKAEQAKGAGAVRGTKADSSVWKEKAVLKTPGWLPGSLAYSSDGKRLAVGGSGGKVMAFDTATYKPKWTADVGGNFAAVAFMADGSSLLATFRDGVRFLDPETGKLGKSLEEPGESPDWRAIAVGVFPDRTIENLTCRQIIFGTPVGYVVKTWYGSGEPGTLTLSTVAKGAKPADAHAVPLAVDPNGTSAIITGPVHRDTRKNVLWAYVCGNYEKGSPGNRLLEGHQAVVVSAAWSKDGSTAVTGDAGGRVIVWDAKTMKETRRLEFGRRIAALALTSDGRQTAAVVVGNRAEFHLWETAKPPTDRKPLHVDAADYRGPIHASLAFSPDDRQLAGAAHNTVWLTRLGELIGKVHVWETANPGVELK
jgi:WD40 repeat protein